MKQLVLTGHLDDDHFAQIGIHAGLADNRDACIGLLGSLFKTFYEHTPMTVEDFHWLADHFGKTEVLSSHTEAAPVLCKREELN